MRSHSPRSAPNTQRAEWAIHHPKSWSALATSLIASRNPRSSFFTLDGRPRPKMLKSAAPMLKMMVVTGSPVTTGAMAIRPRASFAVGTVETREGDGAGGDGAAAGGGALVTRVYFCSA